MSIKKYIKRLLSICITLCIILEMMHVSTIWAQYVPNKKEIERTGPYQLPECQKCKFESTEKKLGAIYENYDKNTGNYLFQEGKYCAHPLGNMYVTMDGFTKGNLFWSEEIYENADGRKIYAAAFTPTKEQTWNPKSAIVCELSQNIGDWCSLYVAASQDGPRDLKIECSKDGGKTYQKLGNVSLKSDKKLQNILADMADMEASVYEDLEKWNKVLRISVASDYKLNGSRGLYGSDIGELIIYDFSMYGNIGTTDTSIILPSLSAYKTGETKVKLVWKKVNGVKRYEIYQRKGKSVFKKIRTIKAANAKKYNCIVKGLSKKGKYNFYIKAVFKDKELSGALEQVDMKKQLIPNDIKFVKQITIKKGKKKKLSLQYRKGANPFYVKNIEYMVKNKKIAVIKKGRIIGKKKGSTNLKVKVTLKSGLKKILKARISVK